MKAFTHRDTNAKNFNIKSSIPCFLISEWSPFGCEDLPWSDFLFPLLKHIHTKIICLSKERGRYVCAYMYVCARMRTQCYIHAHLKETGVSNKNHTHTHFHMHKNTYSYTQKHLHTDPNTHAQAYTYITQMYTQTYPCMILLQHN